MKERTLVWISGTESEVFHYLQRQPEFQSDSLSSNNSRSHLWVGTATSAFPPSTYFDQTTSSLARSLIGTERKLIVYNAFERFDVDSYAAVCGTLIHGGSLFLLTPDIANWPNADLLERQRFTVFSSARNISTQQHSNVQQPSHYIRWMIDRLYSHTYPISDPDAHRASINAETADRAKRVSTVAFSKNRTSSLVQKMPATSVNVRKLHTRQLPDQSIINAMRSLNLRFSKAGSNTSSVTASYSQPNPEQHSILLQWRKSPAGSDSEATAVRILTADRGRGKSALLGMLCADFHSQNRSCVVTGPNRRSSEILMRHCQQHRSHLASTKADSTAMATSHHPRPMPEFIPPDELLANPVNTEVLLVDEAAALPLPVLKRLVQTYQQVILATTVHGYEGAGRGFSIRFREWLQSNNIGYSWKTLEFPVRWLQGDRLEAFCNDAFMLNAEYAVSEQQSISGNDCVVDFYPAERLLKEQNTLRECFALLVQAHYQTKPMDLRHILDGQNIRVFVITYNSAVLGTALVAIEDLGLAADAELKRAIVEKRRRPRGHLMPQLLAQWTQDEAALQLRIARIVRIAIHPQQQNRGLGSFFLKSVEQQLAHSVSLDAIGAMFGEDERVSRYWQHNGYHNFHLGRRKNNRSGARSLAVIKSTGQPLAIIERARHLYSINFSATPSSCDLSSEPQPSSERKQLNFDITQAYLQDNRSFEDSRQFVIALIKARTKSHQHNLANLTKSEKKLLARALQANFEFTDCANELEFSGKKAAEITFKTALEKLLS